MNVYIVRLAHTQILFVGLLFCIIAEEESKGMKRIFRWKSPSPVDYDAHSQCESGTNNYIDVEKSHYFY